jgi:membrane-associated phospholipid phosphatase
MQSFPLLCSDLRNFNSSDSLGNLFVAFGGAAILANTSLDSDFKNWFHRRIIRQKVNSSLNNFNVFTKKFGEINVVAFFVLSTACYKFFPSIFPKYKIGQFTFGNYVTMGTRGYIVGCPSILLGQLFVGAGRPASGTSFWLKGKYNGVSGHAFNGAIPFITAAQITDNLFLKCIFYLCSTFTAASRIYDDAHYLSQALLGWYIAYLSIRAVSKTEGKQIYRGLTIFPIIEKESTGAGIIFKF